MIGFNGGLIGQDRNFNVSNLAQTLQGVWTLAEQIKAQRNSQWPVPTVNPVATITAGTGTETNDYTVAGVGYRAHVFTTGTSTLTFSVGGTV